MLKVYTAVGRLKSEMRMGMHVVERETGIESLRYLCHCRLAYGSRYQRKLIICLRADDGSRDSVCCQQNNRSELG